jgi:hypothetical protein
VRYIIGFLVTIGLIILAFVLLLHGGGSNSAGQAGPLDATKYASTNVVMQLTVDNPITAEDTHRQIVISVGKDSSTIYVYKGYQRTVLTTKTYANNISSYNSFLASLQRAGFTEGNRSKTNDSELGFCPLGDRFVYEVVSGDQDLQRFWSTSCGQGNFHGNRATVLELFQQQIPDYGTLTSSVAL